MLELPGLGVDTGNCHKIPLALAEQLGREFTPAIPATGMVHAALQAYAKFAEIRRRSRVTAPYRMLCEGSWLAVIPRYSI